MLRKFLIGLFLLIVIWIGSYLLGVRDYLVWAFLLSFFALPFVFGLWGISRASRKKRWVVIVWLTILLIIGVYLAGYSLFRYFTSDPVECNFLTGFREDGARCTGDEVTGILLAVEFVVFPIFVILTILTGITTFLIRDRKEKSKTKSNGEKN